MKFFKDMLTEGDNQTWCLLRVGGCVGIGAVLLATLYGCLRYGIEAGATFDTSRIGSLMTEMAHNILELISATSGAVALKKAAGADSPHPQ